MSFEVFTRFDGSQMYLCMRCWKPNIYFAKEGVINHLSRGIHNKMTDGKIERTKSDLEPLTRAEIELMKKMRNDRQFMKDMEIFHTLQRRKETKEKENEQ